MGEALQYVILGNATLFGAVLCAWLFERAAILVNLRTAYRLRLHLALAALCAASLPILLAPFLQLFAPLFPINATDLLVSQYLKGNISLTATQVSEVLATKSTIVETIIGGTSLVSQILLVSFVIAALLRAIYIAINVVKIRWHIVNATPLIKTPLIEVKTARTTTVPFSTRGLRKYYIIIPEPLARDRRALRIALGHEAQHIRQGDVDWEILLSLVSPLFVLNPAFWLISTRIRRLREYACDAAVLKTGTIAAHEYCSLLLEIATRSNRKDAEARCTATVPFFAREGFSKRAKKSALKNRILALSEGACFVDSTASRFVNLLPAALLFCVVGTGVLMAAKPTDWSHERLMLSTVVNLERLDRINGLSVAPLR